MADEVLVLACMEKIEAGEFDVKKLLSGVMELEKHAAAIHAVSKAVRTGDLYTNCGIKQLKDYANLFYILKSLRDLGKDLEKVAKLALDGDEDKKGNNGHSQRMAEFIQEMGMKNFKSEALGTFYLSPTVEAIPPSKKNDPEGYKEYEAWINEKHKDCKTSPSISWSKMQKLCTKELSEEELPEFIKLKKRTETRLRSA